MIKWTFRIFKYVVLPLVLFLALFAAIAYFYPEKFLCVDSGRVSAEVIIVLGGGLHERPVRAAELFHQHAAPRLILSGEGDDLINRDILLSAGVPLNVIEIEGDSTTTQENALFTIQRLRAEKIHRAIIVTSWYHSRRALRTFQHYAPDLQFYSRPSYFAFATGDWKKTGVGKRMRLEFLKLPGYWLCHGVNPF